ncbi:UNKNOWN [Stylonychia lemnae]|uniref:Uncharacterized protein n=1 Tax=Stylonychia lemnae TaxID=5949 RepID=A0A078AB22_STYLE|nr:UNKNOWN [Stylonychia lemnae]|eukprot:CDW77983.1 UNKNOWN [Stylonychia lemnae]
MEPHKKPTTNILLVEASSSNEEQTKNYNERLEQEILLLQESLTIAFLEIDSLKKYQQKYDVSLIQELKSKSEILEQKLNMIIKQDQEFRLNQSLDFFNISNLELKQTQERLLNDEKLQEIRRRITQKEPVKNMHQISEISHDNDAQGQRRLQTEVNTREQFREQHPNSSADLISDTDQSEKVSGALKEEAKNLDFKGNDGVSSIGSSSSGQLSSRRQKRQGQQILLQETNEKQVTSSNSSQKDQDFKAKVLKSQTLDFSHRPIDKSQSKSQSSTSQKAFEIISFKEYLKQRNENKKLVKADFKKSFYIMRDYRDLNFDYFQTFPEKRPLFIHCRSKLNLCEDSEARQMIQWIQKMLSGNDYMGSFRYEQGTKKFNSYLYMSLETYSLLLEKQKQERMILLEIYEISQDQEEILVATNWDNLSKVAVLNEQAQFEH